MFKLEEMQVKEPKSQDVLIATGQKMGTFERLMLDYLGSAPSERSLEIIQQYNEARPKVDLKERRKLLLGNTSLETDLDVMGRDTPEAKAFEDILLFSLEVGFAPALIVLITQVIHPILERNRTLIEALSNAGEKEN